MFQGFSRLLEVVLDFSGLLLTSGQGMIDLSDFNFVACTHYRVSFDFSGLTFQSIVSKSKRMTQKGIHFGIYKSHNIILKCLKKQTLPNLSMFFTVFWWLVQLKNCLTSLKNKLHSKMETDSLTDRLYYSGCLPSRLCRHGNYNLSFSPSEQSQIFRGKEKIPHQPHFI